MILLDTNPILWLRSGHRRARALGRFAGRLYVSPASVLEVQYLVEVGQLRLRAGESLARLLSDSRWLVDSPPAAEWFEVATELQWTRDVFDRLLVAHARHRGWRLATADGNILDRLDAKHVVEL